MYLEKKDYQLRIRLDLLDILLEHIVETTGENTTSEELLAAANKTAVDTIKTKAGVLYDVSEELSKSGNDRNGYLLSLALSIALYELYQRADDDNIPEKVIKNYNDAFKSLDEISKGKEPLDLPAKNSEQNSSTNGTGEDASVSGIGLRRMGSALKRSHRI